MWKKGPTRKVYKTRRRSLMPWNFSLPSRLNMMARKETPLDYERRYLSAIMKQCWHIETVHWRPKKR